MIVETDNYFINKTLDLAKQSGENGYDAFAAILVKDGQIIAQTIDKCIEYIDPTAHAELILISEYCRKEQVISLEGYTLYTSTEPCVMCSGAIHWAKLSKVVFCVSQKGLQQISGGKPKPSCSTLINIGHKKVEIVGPILEEQGLALLKSFPFVSKKERILRNKK